MMSNELERKRILFEEYESLSLSALNADPETLLDLLNAREKLRIEIDTIDCALDAALTQDIERIQVIDTLIYKQLELWRLAAQASLENSKRLKQIAHYFMPEDNIDVERKG